MAVDDRVTREAVREFVDTHDRREIFLGEYEVIHSSGTTGEPTYFVYSEEWETVLAGAVRAVQSKLDPSSLLRSIVTGYRVLYIAATGGRFGGVTAVESGVEYFGSDLRSIDVNSPLEEWRNILPSKPNVLIGYPPASSLSMK